MSEQPASFPHPDYARLVLEPGFRNSQQLLWEHMAAANEAHILMLYATEIISPNQAATTLSAHQKLVDAGADAFAYTPDVEDLFFQVEAQLIRDAGAEAGGNLQIARSRNDLAATMSRLMVRHRLVETMGQVLTLRTTVSEMAEKHVGTLMPGITHTQPAQPTTLAHYLLGVLGPLERDFARLHQAWGRTNVSPLGAAAFTTTSFPIDRMMTADLLGFDGFVVNGYDAVGAGDYLLEATHSLVTMAASLSRFVGDLLIWARADVDILRVSDAFIQISSIMPQKRNPVVLEHIRTRIGYVYGDTNTVAVMVHGAAFGDTNDVEDPIYVPVSRAFNATDAVLTLLDAVLSTASFNEELLFSRAHEGFMTVTALADGFVRDFGLPFRTAHGITSHIVASLASSGQGEHISARIASDAASNELGVDLNITQAWLDRQLDPWHFVESRNGPGGPARTSVEQALTASRRNDDSDHALLNAMQTRIADAERERRRRISNLLVGAGM